MQGALSLQGLLYRLVIVPRLPLERPLRAPAACRRGESRTLFPPLNRIDIPQKWDGQCFQRTTLRDEGLVIQLGHPPGEACACYTTVNEFVVLHVNGIHVLPVRFCACDKVHTHGSPRQQLLRRQWFPATFEQPQTSATLRLLEHFHLQTLQGKVTIYDYYSALQKLTDNTGLLKVPVRISSRIERIANYVVTDALQRIRADKTRVRTSEELEAGRSWS